MNLREDAEQLAIGLELGLVTVGEAIGWADSRISELADPPYSLIEVSMARRSPAIEVAHLLRKIPGDFDVRRVSRRVIGRMKMALGQETATPENIARALYSMHLSGYIPDPDAANEIVSLDDAFDLAQQGTFGTIEEAQSELIDFLDRNGD